MLARALCRRMGIPMLNVVPSMLLRMYVGETSRLTKALFTLARKVQPCLIFVDEMDSLFCTRISTDNVVDRKVITECKHCKIYFDLSVYARFAFFYVSGRRTKLEILSINFPPSYWTYAFISYAAVG